MNRVVVLTGAGISAESGLKTFRGDGGLWEGHRVEDVACPEEAAYDVRIVTQNVDDLHERAGSRHVLHLHGEILYARSTKDPSYTKHLCEADIALGDTCPLGGQLRPHIVWFGDEVPALEEAARIVSQADIFLCVGTSLQVYPANSLIFATRQKARRILVNPEIPELAPKEACECIAKAASVGVPEIVETLLGEVDAGS